MQAEGSNPAVGKKRILVVDDEQSQIYALVLEDHGGYEVIQATDGKAGWDKYLESKPGLVLTDYSMPQMNGDELTKKIMAHNPGEKVLIMTSETDREILQALRKTGAREVLKKGMNVSEILDAVAKYI